MGQRKKDDFKYPCKRYRKITIKKEEEREDGNKEEEEEGEDERVIDEVNSKFFFLDIH